MNWIVDNLNNALGTWNDKLSEIWQLLTQSPQTFKGGDIWKVVKGKPRNAGYDIGIGERNAF